MAISFTPNELTYLATQMLGRLATVDRHGVPQNNPVGFLVDDTGSGILVGGRDLAASRKFRNLAANPGVALVVDDIVSTSPWVVRGIEIRGTAEAVSDLTPPHPRFGRQVIRITPRWVGAWGIEPDERFASRTA